jgi:Uma2 family endonuclease
MAQTIHWTLEELHRLPDDGNKYELVRGELFVTPPPSVAHESILSVLQSILEPYVAAQRLGRIYHPRAVIRAEGSEVEPDLMVRPLPTNKSERWEDAPLPILVVETISGSTRRRDHEQKHAFYVDLGIPEYWIIDGGERTVRVVRGAEGTEVIRDVLRWSPLAATQPLVVDVAALFREALGS